MKSNDIQQKKKAETREWVKELVVDLRRGFTVLQLAQLEYFLSERQEVFEDDDEGTGEGVPPPDRVVRSVLIEVVRQSKPGEHRVELGRMPIHVGFRGPGK